MSGTYRIYLKNCAFFARHGVMDEEKVLGQRFFVDAELIVADRDALDRDDIAGTVHYGEVFQVIEAVVTGERFYLIEALARRIGRVVCERFPDVVRASITVRKPSAPVPGVLDYVEVTVDHPA
ncbi:dihydroneopterin aldolase [Rhizobiaceae bacterium BDR2-2]|uniref:7,8-dihydroneopterin aldolase n=1 Tax=Ectorhizobium quercum TaxID=2965071 RepID=A0AAE3MYU8_9HYPH|nr:dihydroneopterin aldolase [Ectorhizobium quercum]MCX8997543.1 dihydroneopterin aldolase [Ectorhizobium quercum]